MPQIRVTTWPPPSKSALDTSTNWPPPGLWTRTRTQDFADLLFFGDWSGLLNQEFAGLLTQDLKFAGLLTQDWGRFGLLSYTQGCLGAFVGCVFLV